MQDWYSRFGTVGSGIYKILNLKLIQPILKIEIAKTAVKVLIKKGY